MSENCEMPVRELSRIVFFFFTTWWFLWLTSSQFFQVIRSTNNITIIFCSHYFSALNIILTSITDARMPNWKIIKSRSVRCALSLCQLKRAVRILKYRSTLTNSAKQKLKFTPISAHLANVKRESSYHSNAAFVIRIIAWSIATQTFMNARERRRLVKVKGIC